MGISKAGSCETCGLRWRERIVGELCPICTNRHAVEYLRAKLAEAEALAVWAARRPNIVLSVISIMQDADIMDDADILRALREARGGE